VHYGHDAGLRCPWMNDYVFGTRIRTDIIDLDKTVVELRKALNFIAHIAFRKGVILFFTRYPQHIPLVERTAKESGEFAYCKQWKNGSFTDSTRRYGSVIRLPDLCIFLHTHDKLNETHPALNEAAKMLIPTVAICDTDIDPSEITYPIPGNDDSLASLHLYTKLIKEAIMRGKNKREQYERERYEIELAPPN
jgi:small subunit ribosomal protein S2